MQFPEVLSVIPIVSVFAVDWAYPREKNRKKWNSNSAESSLQRKAAIFATESFYLGGIVVLPEIQTALLVPLPPIAAR